MNIMNLENPNPYPHLVELARYNQKRQAKIHALVLAARGIGYQLQKIEGQFCLLVLSDDEDKARAELSLYEEENKDRPPAIEHISPDAGDVVQMLLYVFVLLLFFKLQHFTEGPWTRVGLSDAEAMLAGDWWRAFTALTLHTDHMHLMSNMVFGALYAMWVCRLLGPGIAWATILFSGALANFLTALFYQTDHLAIGASSAVFGALGILIGFEWKRLFTLKASFFKQGAPIFVGICFLAWFGGGDEKTDWFAHMAGLFSGGLLGVLHGFRPSKKVPGPEVQFGFGVATLGLLVFAWLMAWGKI